MSRIMVVDDEPQVRRMLRGRLETEGYEVDEADDGKLALALQRQNSADLIISDMIMPEMDGTELIIKLSREFPDVKIIAISGGGILDAQYHLCLAKEFGANRIFPKPVPLQNLVDTIEELLA
ncbi:MAG: response regulator [Deltaproteobacteria bacterium]|nr:response regulator [Deltaproteobacteria bacterium]